MSNRARRSSPSAGSATADWIARLLPRPARQRATQYPTGIAPTLFCRRCIKSAHWRAAATRHAPRLGGQTYLASYLNEFAFRFNRLRSRRRGMAFFRVLELAVTPVPLLPAIIIKRRSHEFPQGPAEAQTPAKHGAAATNRPWRSAAPDHSGQVDTAKSSNVDTFPMEDSVLTRLYDLSLLYEECWPPVEGREQRPPYGVSARIETEIDGLNQMSVYGGDARP